MRGCFYLSVCINIAAGSRLSHFHMIGVAMDALKNRRSLQIGGSGLLVQIFGFICAPTLVELDPVAGPMIGLGIVMLGSAMLIVGLGYYASAKGHHWAWGLMGMLSIIGLLVLAALPDRQHVRVTEELLSRDVSDPVVKGGPVFHCIGCDYTLNGITSTTCPECGKQFDASNVTTMRVTDELGRELYHKDGPPWTARWSLICGILTLVLFCLPPFNLISAICGISFGHIARRAVRGNPNLIGSAGIALAGLIVSYIGLVVALFFTAFIFIAMMSQ